MHIFKNTLLLLCWELISMILKMQLHTYRSYATTINKKAYRGEKGTNTVTEKTNAQRSKRLNEWDGVLIVIKCNILIGLYFLWCIGKYPEENKYPTVMLKPVPTVIFFLSELEKKWEGRRLRGMTIHFEFPEEYIQS